MISTRFCFVEALIRPNTIEPGAISLTLRALCPFLLSGKRTHCAASWDVARHQTPDPCPLPVAMFIWEQGLCSLERACLCQDVWRALV